MVLLTARGPTIGADGNVDPERERIVVVPLENRTGDKSLDPVGRIAADWIVQGLARTELLDVVPSSEVSEGAKTVQPAMAKDAETGAHAVARAVEAGTLVAGSYHRRGSEFEFQVQVADVVGRRVVWAIDGVRGTQSDPMPAIDELRRRILGAVALRFDARIPQELYSTARPPSYEAYQMFAAGEDHRNRFEWRRALAAFTEAYALDTTFTTALLLAVIQHINLREFAEADSLVRSMARTRERLPPFERQLLYYVEAQVRGDLSGVLQAMRGLARFGKGFQGSTLEALNANRPREAVAGRSIADLRLVAQRPPMWRLANARQVTEAYHRLGDYRRELVVATQARMDNPGILEPILWETRALAGLGQTLRAREHLEEALSMLPDPQWPLG